MMKFISSHLPVFCRSQKQWAQIFCNRFRPPVMGYWPLRGNYFRMTSRKSAIPRSQKAGQALLVQKPAAIARSFDYSEGETK